MVELLGSVSRISLTESALPVRVAVLSRAWQVRRVSLARRASRVELDLRVVVVEQGGRVCRSVVVS